MSASLARRVRSFSLGVISLILLTPAAPAQQTGVTASPGVVKDWWSTPFNASAEQSWWWEGEPVATVDMDRDGLEDVVYAELEEWNFTPSIHAWSGADGHALWTVTSNGQYYASLAAHPDVDGDGRGDLLLGGPPNVDVRSGLDGSLLGTIQGPPWTGFGGAVAAVPDVTGDGVAEILVGAAFATVGGNWGAGSALLYSGAGLGQPPLLQVTGSTYGELLGWSVAGTEDLDADLVPDFLVGASGYWASVPVPGSTAAYSGATGGLIWRTTGSPGDDMGSYVQTIDDLDGDGVRDVVTPPAILSGASGAVIRVLAYGFVLNDLDGDGVQDLLGDSGDRFPPSTLFEGGLYSGASGELLFGMLPGRIMDEETWLAGGPDLDGDGRHELFVVSFPETGSPRVWLERIDAGLVASRDTISLGAGGTLRLDLDFAPAAAFQQYRLVTSASGSGFLPVSLTLLLPLAYDQTVYQTYLGQYPPFATGMFGMLDAQGKATGLIAFPPGLPASLLGKTYTIAAMAGYPWGFWTATSFPASWTFVP